MQTVIRQERPSLYAIVANRGLDTLVIFTGILIIALPFFALMKEMGILFVILAFVGALLGGTRIIFDLLEREYSLYTLENDRLIVDRGFFNRQRVILPLDATHIQRVVAHQPILGRLVGYGHVNIFTLGWGLIRLRYVSNPYAWQEDILQRLGQAIVSTIPVSQSQLTSIPRRTQTANRSLGQLLIAFSGILLLVCVCSLVFSTGKFALAEPTPTPTPRPGALVLPSITIGDMFGALWSIYQIPTVFWIVNVVIMGNIVIFFIKIFFQRRR